MKNYFKSLFFVFTFGLSLTLSAQTTQWKEIHTVKKKETIFGIAKNNGISIEELLNANPEMKQVGYELKKGATIFIPYARGEKAIGVISAQPSANTNPTTQYSVKKTSPVGRTIRVGVMLPLHNNDGDGRRMVEYYRGMLMAFNQLKGQGINTEVNAWNVPVDADIRTTLLKPGVNNLDIIFGPLYSNQVTYLAEFCHNNHITMVIPFSIEGNDVARYPEIFQIYQPENDLLQKSVLAFMERFQKTHHPVLIDCNDVSSNKSAFTKGIRQQMDDARVKYNLTNVNTPLLDFSKAFVSGRPNVVVVNTQRSPELNRVFAKLDSLKQYNPGLAISMYGYTDWLMYQKHDLNYFFKYGVYIPTTFYYNSVADKTVALEAAYKKQYGEVMDPNGLPRFAITGYDQAMYFIQGLHKYGMQFTGAENQSAYKALQSRLSFNRVGAKGGYKNNNFQLIHFMNNQTMESLTY